MSDVSQGPGWWQASDAKWYAPEQHPDAIAAADADAAAADGAAAAAGASETSQQAYAQQQHGIAGDDPAAGQWAGPTQAAEQSDRSDTGMDDWTTMKAAAPAPAKTSIIKRLLAGRRSGRSGSSGEVPK